LAIITISRGTFSGGQSLAECIAGKLGYRCISREVLTEAAEQYGADEKKLFKILVEKPGLLERLSLERQRYLTFVQAALYKEARDEKLVYHGHAGHLLLKDAPHIIRVRVVAHMEQRIKAAMDRHGFERKAAIEYIGNMDGQRIKWTKFLYHVDWRDPSIYDVLINLDHISISSACELVCTIANAEEYQITAQSEKMLADLALSTDVKARIVADNNVADEDIWVNASWGSVTVSGTVGLPEELDRISDIVQSTPGVVDFKSTIRMQPHWAQVQGRYIK